MALKDITLGQYFPGNSLVHRLDPRTKLHRHRAVYRGAVPGQVALCPMASCCCSWLVCIAHLQGPAEGPFCEGMKPVVFIVVFTAILNLFYTAGARCWCSFWIFTITEEGVLQALASWCCAS